MTSLTAIFGNSREESGDSEKLLELYWNRAELKKEFARLREETFQLKDQIKTKDGAAARLQQKLEHLENLLCDPEWVFNVMIYYQLRALNLRCTNKVARFAEQLKQQREKRQHHKFLQVWNGKRNTEVEVLERQIGEQRMEMQILEDQLQAERHRLTTMHGFLRFFRKRSITKSLDNIAAKIGATHERETDLLHSLDEIRSREAPDTRGLDISAKRSINLMILSFAQQMYLHFADDDLVALSKDAGDKSVGAINYGKKKECLYLLKHVMNLGGGLENVSDYVDVMQHRARLLSDGARFKSNEDAVPTAETVATLYTIEGEKVTEQRSANLLGENYWGLAQVFSR